MHQCTGCMRVLKKIPAMQFFPDCFYKKMTAPQVCPYNKKITHFLFYFLLTPLENQIHIFAQPCNILYVSTDLPVVLEVQVRQEVPKKGWARIKMRYKNISIHCQLKKFDKMSLEWQLYLPYHRPYPVRGSRSIK